MRRQIITHPQFQYRFTLSFIFGTWLMGGLIGGFSVFSLYFIARNSNISVDQSTLVLSHLKNMALLIIGVTVALSALLGALGLYLSYKMVGPVIRLESWMEDHLKGNHSGPLTLRTGDDLKPIVTSLHRILGYAKKGTSV